MNITFQDLLDTCVTVYLDDILVYSADANEHEAHLRLVLERLGAHRLFAKRSKCSFGESSVEYLGHFVGSGVRWMHPKKVEAVVQWSPPTTVKELQSFMGLANYYN